MNKRKHVNRFFLKKSQLFILKYSCTTTIHLSSFCRNLNTLITNLITYFGQVMTVFHYKGVYPAKPHINKPFSILVAYVQTPSPLRRALQRQCLY